MAFIFIRDEEIVAVSCASVVVVLTINTPGSLIPGDEEVSFGIQTNIRLAPGTPFNTFVDSKGWSDRLASAIKWLNKDTVSITAV